MKGRFCYEISAEVGMGEDTETGEPCAVYAQMEQKDKAGALVEIPEEEYAVLHTGPVKRLIAHSWGIPESMVKPIETAEYDANTADDPDGEGLE